jgi:hypothetical protein
MLASVHIADVGVRKGLALALLRGAPKPGAVPGLRSADIGLAAPLGPQLVARPSPGRVALIAFWDDDEDLDRFLNTHPVAAKLAGGFQMRLAPLRRWGTWPGVDDDIPTGRAVDHDGPAAVLTLGRWRWSQVPRFLRTSRHASGRAAQSPGLLWGTALANPPFVSTCSLWESSRALTTYAYGMREPEHSNAIDADKVKPFHHQSAFIRFRPYASHGHLDGRNPLPDSLLS